MQNTSFVERSLPALVSEIATAVDLETTARQYRALLRKRHVKSAADLLKLVLLYGVGGYSLRTTAGVAAAMGVATLCDVCLLERLQRSVPWLEHLLLARLNRRAPPGVLGPLACRLTLIDGPSLSVPGSHGTDRRVPVRYDPSQGRWTALHLTDAHAAESLSHFAIAAPDVVVADRGSAKAKALAAVIDRGGDVIVRTGWRALPLRHRDGRPLDLIARLRTRCDSTPVSVPVAIALTPRSQKTRPARLIIARKPSQKAPHGKPSARPTNRAAKQSRTIRPETERAAQFLILVTTLDDAAFPAAVVLALYALRWQVELAIQRLKSVVGLKHLSAFDPQLAKAWLLANLIAALVIDDLVHGGQAFPPCGVGAAGKPAVPVAASELRVLMLLRDLFAALPLTAFRQQPHLLRRLCEPKRRRLTQVASAGLWLS